MRVFGFRNKTEVVTITIAFACQAIYAATAYAMSHDVEAPKKIYSPPYLTTRSREQATLFLVGHAWVGNRAARDLLELLFPEPGHK